ncbi:MAG: ribosome maturation factor RimM [Zoogloeaceae bacterium]|nr:ribosome maturation factor RimM [Zoogloeaceae bacterium]
MPEDTGFVILGRVAGPYGVKGWVKILPFADDPLSWREMPHWHLAPQETGAWQVFPLVEFRAQGQGFIARFASIADRSAAEAIRSWWIGVPCESLPPLPENEFYWEDLIGLTVENEAGEILGQVAGLIETGAHDVLRVQDAGSDVERLIPFVDAIVKTVDLPGKRLYVRWEADW